MVCIFSDIQTAAGAGPWSIANRSFPQEQHQQQHATVSTQQSQASTTTTAEPVKKGAKGKSKVV